jgi:hypothetical protein
VHIYIGTLRVRKGREGKGREGKGREGKGRVYAFPRQFNENPRIIPGYTCVSIKLMHIRP